MDYVKEHKVKHDHISLCFFQFMDLDQSGELEPDEILIFDRRQLGQS